MSSYTKNQIKEYGISAIRDILPLDDDTLSQMVDYAITGFGSRDGVSQHFINLLGESPAALDFIARFNNMLFGNPQQTKPKPKKTTLVKPSKPVKPVKNTQTPWTEPQGNSSTEGKQRLANTSSTGATTSQLLDLKPNAVKKADFTKKNAQKKLENLKDLDAALLELEENASLNVDPSEDSTRRVCNCNATRHALFEMFPNCLNCGKIICVKEGLQPCSFCGKDLLTTDEKRQILNILRKEKDDLEGTKGPVKTETKTGKQKKNKITISVSSAGQNNYKVQDQLFKRIEMKKEQERKKEQQTIEEKQEIEEMKKEMEYYSSIKGKDDELLQAEKRLETLLNFQQNGAQRTKIIDQASDFDTPANSSLNPWASHVERALQLKKQQRQLRKMETQEKARTGRGKKVMDMTIRNNKVYLKERAVAEDSDVEASEEEEIQDLEDKLNKESVGRLEENSKKVWDYKQDKSKWEKPVYVGEAQPVEESSVPETSDISEIGHVVQFGGSEEIESALIGMVGV